jgi:hypothetical protein
MDNPIIWFRSILYSFISFSSKFETIKIEEINIMRLNKIPYGMTSDGVLKHIDEVSNGQDCNCFCPDCHCRLSAKNGGEIRIHHFAHIDNKDCQYSGETVLHKFAKESFLTETSISLPEVKIKNYVIDKESSFVFHQVSLEERIDSIIPDVQLVNNSSEKLFVEIKVYHGIDSEKEKKLTQMNVDCIEIDLSDLVKHLFDETIKQQVIERVINSVEYKNWAYSTKVNKFIKTKTDNKFLVKDVLFDKDTFCEIETNEKLTWRTSLDWIWRNNGLKPFIAFDGNSKSHLNYIYINKSPEIALKKDGYVKANKCKIDHDNFISVHGSMEQYFYFEVDLDPESEIKVFYPQKSCWYYVQDRPDYTITLEDKLLKKELESKKQENRQRKIEYNQLMEKRRENIQASIKASYETQKRPGRKLMTLLEISEKFGKQCESIEIKNVETGEVVLLNGSTFKTQSNRNQMYQEIWIILNLNPK